MAGEAWAFRVGRPVCQKKRGIHFWILLCAAPSARLFVGVGVVVVVTVIVVLVVIVIVVVAGEVRVTPAKEVSADSAYQWRRS